MNIERVLTELKAFDAIRDGDECKTDSLARIEPVILPEWPNAINTRLLSALEKIGLSSPYQHQYHAVEEAMTGANVVLECPTASGKTLAFAIPILNKLIDHPSHHALLIYPMKSVATDQCTQINELCKRLPGPTRLYAQPYDGNVPNTQKRTIRQNPPAIIATNPEYLNSAMLGNKHQWEGFLTNLRYVVIDEMHEYRGFFGSNMSLLIRRFNLQLTRLGTKPQYFLSSATCANPKTHAENLTGMLNWTAIQAKNAFRPKRDFIFINPNIRDFKYRDIFRRRIVQASLACHKLGLHILVFCQSKNFLEETLIRCREKARTHNMEPSAFQPFHADLSADDRREIQQDIKTGSASVVFTTTALELGIDIGGLDGRHSRWLPCKYYVRVATNRPCRAELGQRLLRSVLCYE